MTEYQNFPKVKRNILLNPGPSTTTDTVKFAQIIPDICPREEEFTGVMKEVREGLVGVAHGNLEEHTCILFSGSGTLNIDACISSLLPQDKKALIVTNGTYSDRAIEAINYYGIQYEAVRFKDNEVADPKVIEEVIKKNIEDKSSFKFGYVYMTHQETGTGIINPLREIGSVAHKYNLPLIADTTSTFAMIPIDIVKDNVDVIMASAQKGIMAMSGLTFLIANRKLIEASKNFPKRSYYCNIYRQYEYFERTGQMNFTPPVQTIYAARQGIKEYFQEGEIKKWERHQSVMAAIRKGVDELGFKEYLERTKQSGLVSTIIYPDDENWNFKKIHDYCFERGFTIYPGTGGHSTSFRLTALGAINNKDIENFWKVFKEGLEYYHVSIPIKYNNK